jgi:poly-D-alanine transfer protein DltD
MLFTLPQLADYTGYSQETIRTYYSRGYLPEPKNIKVTKGKNGKVYIKRLFTLEEMEEIKNLLQNYTQKELKDRFSNSNIDTTDIINSKIKELKEALQ